MTTATLPAVELARLIRLGELGSVELLELYVHRIERLNGDINAVVTLDVERARAACAAADEARARGDELGPLHGLPVTIKDAIATAGVRSTGGAVELRDHVPSADAPAVARLKAAGAVVFGKSNLPRWSADYQAYNDLFGTTNNPWDRDRTPGGSSGGAAAALAAGFTAFELGTDIGGSVRIPSHFCGTFALKPSFGVVPQLGYLDHVDGGTTDVDINVFGPMARSADDLAVLLDVLAGPSPADAVGWKVDLPPSMVGGDLAGARVAVWFDDAACPIDAEYRALLQRVADELADAGARVEATHPPVELSHQLGVFLALVSAAMSPSLPDEVGDRVSGSHRGWLQLDRERARLRALWAEWFGGWDVLLCPVTPTPAIRHDHSEDAASRTITVNGETRSYFDSISWTGLIGVVGLPSAVAPIGRTAAGLPVGVQVVAPYLHDRTAIDVAALIATTGAVDGYQPPPGFD